MLQSAQSRAFKERVMLNRDHIGLEAARREAQAARAVIDLPRLQQALAVLTAIKKRIYVAKR